MYISIVYIYKVENMDTCHICQEGKELISIVNHLRSLNTECTHRFCSDCIDKWHFYLQNEKKSTTCPLCREVLRENGTNQPSAEENEQLLIRFNDTDLDTFLNPTQSISDSSFNERYYLPRTDADKSYENESVVSDLSSFSQRDDRGPGVRLSFRLQPNICSGFQHSVPRLPEGLMPD